MGHAVNEGERRAADDFLRWASFHEGVIVRRVDEDSAEVGLEAPCKHLTFDEKGNAGCSIYEGDRPEICKAFPAGPTPNCPGFRFVEGDEVENVSNKEA